MQRFTIDFLTGNTRGSYTEGVVSTDAEIHVANHDGLLTSSGSIANHDGLLTSSGSIANHDGLLTSSGSIANHDGLLTSSGSNFLHNSLHLEDVYSVINKDAALLTSPLVIDSTYDCSQNDTETLSSPTETNPQSESDITPLSSPNVQTELGYQYTLERATPSPDKDSGIDSDNSPVSSGSSSTENVNKSIRDLEKKAEKISASKLSEKPLHSYIALIAMAILDSRDRKLTLGDIYRHIMDNNPYYNNEEKAWRNSIRYNLSINECFIKAGKDECAGKGNLWAIHPACYEDFKNGDFRRRQARRRARRTLRGLGPADSNLKTEKTSLRTSTAYQPMTPSYVNYHPYATSGLTQRHHQMPDYAHAYSAHIPMSSSYYNSYGHYPAAQYTPMSMSNFVQPTYDYSQQYSRAYPGFETSNTTMENTEKTRQDPSESKYYHYPTECLQTYQQENVPPNNKIEIL